jgi:plasmid stabilization system protein ParE
MTRYTVTWLKGARNHLAQLWMDAPDQEAVRAAADAIDIELSKDAGRKGTPVSEGLRTLYVPPLRVLFSANDEDRLVEVASVRADDSRPPAPKFNGKTDPPGSPK